MFISAYDPLFAKSFALKYLFHVLLLFSLATKPNHIFGQIARQDLAESQIDVPILIDLRPIYSLTEKNVASVYTSSGYPEHWIELDCSTRYKYTFRRSPFQFTTRGNGLDLAFIGYYKIIGSSRVCVNGAVISPWSPPCRCGFDEGERRVQVSFSTAFNLQRDFTLKTTFTRNEPRPLNKCEVCFWGRDVTNSVLSGLKTDLDASRKALEDSFGTVNLRPHFTKLWHALSETYDLPGIGYFSLRPKTIRMENLSTSNDWLQLKIGINASPVVQFTKAEYGKTPLPAVAGAAGKSGFNINLEAALQYDSLSQVLSNALHKKRFDLSEGLIKKHIIVEAATVKGSVDGKLVIRVGFSGSFIGYMTFQGEPVYDREQQLIEVKDLQYALESKNFLLKTAQWLFNNKIKQELQRHTRFYLTDYYSKAKEGLRSQLNKEWAKGVKSFGEIAQLELISVEARPDHLLIYSNASGKLGFLIPDISLSFNH